MSLARESAELHDNFEKHVPVEPAPLGAHVRGRQFSLDAEDQTIIAADQNKLHKDLKGRHMQMIAM